VALLAVANSGLFSDAFSPAFSPSLATFASPRLSAGTYSTCNGPLNMAATVAGVRDSTPVDADTYNPPNEVSAENPVRVIVAGAGVGGLSLANALKDNPLVDITILERTDEFRRFGGPIQLASNALKVIETMCEKEVYDQVMEKFTFTGDKENGIKDGIRDEWYAKFDLATPAEQRNMPYTGVIERPDLQNIFLSSLEKGTVRNGDGVASYKTEENGSVTVTLDSGKQVHGDVLVGADGIWSAVRATMRDEPIRGDGSGVSYSGYTVFAGELNYDSVDHGKVGYKVYIGPGQYFVITDIGNGRYQWYAFLARAPGSAAQEEKPKGNSIYLQDIFLGWSKDVHHILKATTEDEIDQRDLYDRPPSVLKPWSEGPVCLLGDAVHAMMPNLGQGGCQAIEDALVIKNEMETVKYRSEISDKLKSYSNKRLIRSAAVQGLSRFASDIIIRGFDTPFKMYMDEGKMKIENFNYAGVVTRMLQPILPIFFAVQFNFLYEGWRNDLPIDLKATFGFLTLGGLVLLVGAGSLGEVGALGVAFDALVGGEGLEATFAAIRELFTMG
jgi:zeaxanthin epoxidase